MGTTASRMSTLFNAHLFFAKLPCKAAQHSSAADASGSRAISRAPEERTKVPDVFYGLEVEDFLNQVRGLRCAEDRCDQVAGFGDDFVAGHGIFRGAADIVDALLETGAIGECELHDGGFVGGQLDVDLLHLRSVEGMLLAQNFEGVEGRLDGRADRPALDVGARDFVALAYFVE